MKRKSSMMVDSLEVRKLSRMYSGYRRFVAPCGFRSLLLPINRDHKASLLALVFCVATCATQNLVTDRAFAEGPALRLNGAESKTAGTVAVEQVAFWLFERRSSQLTPSLHGPDVSKSPFGPVPAHSFDQVAAYEPALHQLRRAGKSASLLINDFFLNPTCDCLREKPLESAASANDNNVRVVPRQGTPRCSLLLLQPNSRSFDLANTYKIGGDDSRVLSPEPTSPDVSILVNERVVHVKPLMEVRLGTYNLPIALYVPNPPGSLTGPR